MSKDITERENKRIREFMLDYRNELFYFLRNLDQKVICEWLNWLRHFIDVAIKGEKCN